MTSLTSESLGRVTMSALLTGKLQQLSVIVVDRKIIIIYLMGRLSRPEIGCHFWV
jgi:hypothetical protein